MTSRRPNPNLIKLNRTYSVGELATRLGLHKNTIRQWQRDGLTPIDGSRPTLFHSSTIRAFIGKRNARRKMSCPPGTIFCLRCRSPRVPALGIVKYEAFTATTGNLGASCGTCGAMMHRKVRLTDIPAVMPGCQVRHTQGA